MHGRQLSYEVCMILKFDNDEEKMRWYAIHRHDWPRFCKEIKGIMYDTTRAQFIARREAGHYEVSEGSRVAECLYKTIEGYYFIHIIAYKLRKAAIERQNIRVVSTPEARAFLEDATVYLTRSEVDDLELD